MDNLIWVHVELTQRKDFIKLLRGNSYTNASSYYSPAATLLLVDNEHKSFTWLRGFMDSHIPMTIEDFIDLFL